MKINHLTVSACFLFAFTAAFGQTVNLDSNQANALQAVAGNDTTIISGRQAILGSHPTAIDGYGGYIYHWSPATSLSDVTQPNPVARPLVTTTYMLTITDMKNCSSSDEVTITVEASGIDINQILARFRVYPNPSDDNLNVDLDGISGSIRLRMINSTGVVIYDIDREINDVLREELDTRFLPMGNYLIMLIYKDKIVTRSVVVF
ncbi:MAG: T9SS type A sorting domain-containing protein [Bacteroidia bacterium]|nr:T9SS type A sorting domain-containing protein [Bacteroidia bacterium]